MIGLQTHSTYSMLSGLFLPEDWCKAAKERGYTHLALTDKHNLAGIVGFEKECLKNGIEPIIGEEFRFIKSKADKSTEVDIGTILIYAKDSKGYENLVKLNNTAHKRDKTGCFYNRPKIDLESIFGAENIICVLPIDQIDDTHAIDEVVKMLSAAFEKDFYIGFNLMSESPAADWLFQEYFEKYRDIAVPLYNSHYINEDQHYLYDVVRKIDHSRTSKILMNLDQELSRAFLPADHSEYRRHLSEDQLAILTRNAQSLVSDITFRLDKGSVKMPEPQIKGTSVDGDIEDWIVTNINKKFGVKVNSLDEFLYDPFLKEECPGIELYQERIEHEISVIKKKNFMPYFHHVKNICDIHDKKYTTRGAGRGSAGGSLLCYILGITSVDAIRFGLLFSRFLDEERADFPDIDLDFSSEGRDYVLEELRKIYGKTRVAKVTAYSRLKIKSGIKAYHRSFGGGFPINGGGVTMMSSKELDSLLNVEVPATNRGERELREMCARSEAFNEFYLKHSEWFDRIVMPLQETAINTSLHASATVITHDDLDKTWPVFFIDDKDSEKSNYLPAIQLEYPDAEECGAIKFDLLVMDGISIIEMVKDLVGKKDPSAKFPKYDEIDLDNPEVLEIFALSETHGVPQFKSGLQRRHMPLLKPKKFAHLSASVALVRPGPMSVEAHTYHAEVVNGKRKESYLFPALEPILKSTYGFVVYQEQAMKIAQTICGFTMGETNKLRKVMGKKKVEEMPLWRNKFIDGGVANGHDADHLEELWSIIAAFAEYSFNESHAVAYAMNAYYVAYLKCYYPLEYWCALLASAKTTKKKGSDGDLYSLKPIAEREGVEFIYPSIKGFASEFTPKYPNKIFWPLGRVKSMGQAADYLNKHGNSFETLDEFVEYICSKPEGSNRLVITTRHIKTMISIGFFHPFGSPLDVANYIYPKRNEILNKKDEVPEMFRDNKSPLYWAEIRNDHYGFEVTKWKDVAGFSPEVKGYTDMELRRVPKDDRIAVGGRVTQLYINKIKAGRNAGSYFANITLEDGDEKYNIKMWSDFWEDANMDLEHNRPRKGDLYEVVGVKDEYNGRHQIVCSSYQNTYSKVIWRESLC